MIRVNLKYHIEIESFGVEFYIDTVGRNKKTIEVYIKKIKGDYDPFIGEKIKDFCCISE